MKKLSLLLLLLAGCELQSVVYGENYKVYFYTNHCSIVAQTEIHLELDCVREVEEK